MSEERLLTTRELAERCRVVPETVRRWVREGRVVPDRRTVGRHMRFGPEGLAQALGGAPVLTERAQDMEAHVMAARQKMRLRRALG